MLTREQILAADDLRFVDVDVPEWGGSVRIRTMTARERQKYQAMIADAKGKMPGNFMEQYVSVCAVDDHNKALFTSDDLVALGNKNAVALNRVFEACIELNAASKDSVDAIKGE